MEKSEAEKIRLAPFWARILAGTLDFALIVLAIGLLEAPIPDSAGILFEIIEGLLEFGILFGYFAVSYARYQTTLGKKLFRLRIVRDSTLGKVSLGRCIARAFAFPLSLVMGVGLLMALFHPRRQALHDVIASTRVVRVS